MKQNIHFIYFFNVSFTLKCLWLQRQKRRKKTQQNKKGGELQQVIRLVNTCQDLRVAKVLLSCQIYLMFRF